MMTLLLQVLLVMLNFMWDRNGLTDLPVIFVENDDLKRPHFHPNYAEDLMFCSWYTNFVFPLPMLV